MRTRGRHLCFRLLIALTLLLGAFSLPFPSRAHCQAAFHVAGPSFREASIPAGRIRFNDAVNQPVPKQARLHLPPSSDLLGRPDFSGLGPIGAEGDQPTRP